MNPAFQPPKPWDILVAGLNQATRENKFSYEHFFPYWFREHGTPYFFLFSKNLSVTNIQHAELLALLRQHARDKNTGAHVHDLTFHTNAMFQETVDDIVRPVVESVHFTAGVFHTLASLYWPLISRSVVIDQFFTSAAVFLPPNVDVDLIRICAESGYIHSCGYSVFVRRVTKAAQIHFYDSIDRHIGKYPYYDGRLQFIAYAKEDFADDKDSVYAKEALQDGLDGVKLRVEKMHMNGVSLVRVFGDMASRYRNRLIIPPAGPYKHAHPTTSESTLWLIADQSINRSNPRGASSDKYYLCYHQLYVNESPFHLFDENKPAWIAHNTIPHSLLGAMINITKPWPSGETVTIGDPFSGTGTTWLESLEQADASCGSSDINPLFPALLADNLSFFALPRSELLQHMVALEDLASQLKGLGEIAAKAPDNQPLLLDTGEPMFPPAYQNALAMIKSLTVRDGGSYLSIRALRSDLPRFRKLLPFERLVFYVALRAEIRSQYAILRGTKDRTIAFAESARYLLDEMKLFESWLTRATSEEAEDVGVFALFPSHYSKGCALSIAQLSAAASEFNMATSVSVEDAREMKAESYDVIVTDPPYGFNTEEDLLDLSRLYADVARALVRAVRDSGHLVICLPSESSNGRDLPFCTKRQLVTNQILRAAESLGREVYLPARAAMPLASPPYYWSAPTLRRNLLHFRVHKKGQLVP